MKSSEEFESGRGKRTELCPVMTSGGISIGTDNILVRSLNRSITPWLVFVAIDVHSNRRVVVHSQRGRKDWLLGFASSSSPRTLSDL